MQSSADDQKRRQFRRCAAHLRHHAAQGRTGEPANGLPSSPTPPACTAGQTDGAGHAVIVGAVCSERTRAKRWACFAICGNNSPMRMPVTEVAIGEKGPRNSSGAAGLGSQVSRWAGPPHSHKNSTERAEPFAVEPAARRRKKIGQRQTQRRNWRQLQHACARVRP